MSAPCGKCGSGDHVHDAVVDPTTGDAIHVARCLVCGFFRALVLPPAVDASDVAALGTPIPSGWALLDAALAGGLLPGLCVVAAPTGVGKTAWLTQQADQLAAAGRPVVFVAAEPTPDEVRARLAAPRLGVSWREVIISGARTRDALAGIPIYIVTEVPQDAALDEVRLRHNAAPVVVVDHLHAIARRWAAASGDIDTRSALGTLTQSLTDLAARRRAVVIAAAQVARSWYSSQSQDERPKSGRDYVAAAKDAGEIEADAAYVLYLDVEGSRANVHIAKARYSPSDLVVEMTVDLAIGRYADADPTGAAGAVNPNAPSQARSHSRNGRNLEAKIIEILHTRGPRPRQYLIKSKLGVRDQTVYETVTAMLAAGQLVEVAATGTAANGRSYTYQVLALPEPLPGSHCPGSGSAGADLGSGPEPLPDHSIYIGGPAVAGSDDGTEGGES
ncbi:MAG: AAA family ATPase [Deltaproteobacteria bacterium]|nr:AAA family ATPase [Deltaproteobacteria bacterium]